MTGAADKRAKFLANRFVQETGKRSVEIVDRDEFNDVGKVLVSAARAAEPKAILA